MNVPMNRKAKAIFVTKDEAIEEVIKGEQSTFGRLAAISEATVQKNKDGLSNDAVAIVVNGAEIYLPLEELIDMEKEIERLEKEKANLQMEVDRVNKKLGNEGFVAKAPADVIDSEKEKLKKYSDMYEKVIERIQTLKKHK